MPLRDHFRPTLPTSWEELHAGWPMVIVQQLQPQLPANYAAGPRAHAGAQVEIDVATAVWVAEPVVSVETDLAEEDEYEVRIYDVTRGRTLVAAIEIVSPANKDRPETRNAFVGKCAALLRKGVAVSIVDVVTTRQFNLYAELMAFVGHPDPTMSDTTPHLYATSCRLIRREPKAVLQSWSHALALGQPLPTLPLWLAEKLVVPLDLEASYERTCRDLRIA